MDGPVPLVAWLRQRDFHEFRGIVQQHGGRDRTAASTHADGAFPVFAILRDINTITNWEVIGGLRGVHDDFLHGHDFRQFDHEPVADSLVGSRIPTRVRVAIDGVLQAARAFAGGELQFGVVDTLARIRRNAVDLHFADGPVHGAAARLDDFDVAAIGAELQ